MKVLIDTNVFVSYLLASGAARTVTTVVRTCFEQDVIDVLVPPEQIDELAATLTTKGYFRTRLSSTVVQHFIAQLTAFVQVSPPREDLAAYSRDAKDDYLAAYGVINEADYLITGDHDVLVLDRLGELRMVTPAQFLDVLQENSLLPPDR